MIHQKDLRLGDLVQITVDLPEYKQGDTFVVIDICEIYIGLRSPSESGAVDQTCTPSETTSKAFILLPTSLKRTDGIRNMIQLLLAIFTQKAKTLFM